MIYDYNKQIYNKKVNHFQWKIEIFNCPGGDLNSL
jgi:hypothetical protein